MADPQHYPSSSSLFSAPPPSHQVHPQPQQLQDPYPQPQQQQRNDLRYQTNLSHLQTQSSRRSSATTASSTQSPSIPPAPPLPPPPQHHQRYTARNALARIVQPFTAYGSRPPSAQANRADAARSNPLVGRIPGVSALSSQDASHKTGLEITALDINEDRTYAILAGREILKTIRVDGTRCSEETNIRSAIKNYQSHNATGTVVSTRQRETLDIHDVKWSHGGFSNYVATAATSGKIVLYDLHRAGFELARLHEHHRQVHKIAFNPHQGHILLSGSQDTTVRLWDLRDLRRDIMTCPSRERFLGQSDGVRAVKWSPTEGFEFAFGTDNGVIQRWDYRYNRGPKLKLNAHDKTVTSIDWHPDGKHILSASTDRNVKIWDFSSDRRRQKPSWSIRTPYPIYQARWRPPVWADGAWHTSQLATAYDREHPIVNIWDFRRPHLPFRELARYSTAPTDMLWHSRDLLWTVGREGIFTQTDVHFAPKVVDRRNMQSFSLAPNGEVHAFTQKRPNARRSKPRGIEEDFATETPQKRNSPEKGSLSRSSADDSVDDSFLSSSYHRRNHARSASHRSAKSLGNTPPSAEDSKKVIMLETILDKASSLNLPNQIAFRGTVPSTFNLQVFTYLAQKYKSLPPVQELTVDFLQNIQRIFDQNAQYSTKAAGHRVAFSWQILGYALSQVLMERAEANRTRRLKGQRKERLAAHAESPTIRKVQGAGKDTVAPTVNPTIRALQDQASPAVRSATTSHTATPVARPSTQPVNHAVLGNDKTQKNSFPKLADPDEDEALKLPDSLLNISPMQQGSLQSSDPSYDSSRSALISHNSYTTPPDLGSNHVRNWKPTQRTPLVLDPTTVPTSNYPPPMDRHNSDESFSFFPASADSHPGMSMASSFASGRSRPDLGWSRWDDAESQTESSLGNSGSAVSGQDSSGRRSSFRKSRTMSSGSRLPELLEESDAPSSFSDSLPSPAIQERPTNLPRVQTDTNGRISPNTQVAPPSASSESDALTSSHSLPSSSFADSENMEASGTIIPDHPRSSKSLHPPMLRPDTESAPAAIDGEISPHTSDFALKVSDFLPTTSPDLEKDHAFKVVDILNQLLDFHTSIHDFQTASHLLLLCLPLLPQSSASTSRRDSGILDAYSTHLESILAPTASPAKLARKHIAPLLRAGLDPLKLESILASYHVELQRLGLHNCAAVLRRLSYPAFPAVYEQSLRENTVLIICSQCRNPIHNSRDPTVCDSCHTRMSPCPICWSPTPPTEFTGGHERSRSFGGSKRKHKASRDLKAELKEISTTNVKNQLIVPVGAANPPLLSHREKSPALSKSSIKSPASQTLWTHCLLCNHGGHTACLAHWFGAELPPKPVNPVLMSHLSTTSAGGQCPTDGCLCDCVRGPYRDECNREAEARAKEKNKFSVREDSRVVSESKAVRGVRGQLGPGAVVREDSGGLSGATGLGIMSGGGGRAVEKRVRVMDPEGVVSGGNNVPTGRRSFGN